MKNYSYVLIFFCLACPPLQAQKLKELYVFSSVKNLATTIRAGDKILIAYNLDYTLRYPHKVYSKKKQMNRRNVGTVLYGKERVLRVTDTCLIFMNGGHVSYESILTIRKLSLVKQIARTVGTISGSTMCISFPFGTAVGLWLIRNNNNRLENRHLVPCKMKVSNL